MRSRRGRSSGEGEEEDKDHTMESVIKEEDVGQMIQDLHTLLTHDTPSEQAEPQC